MNWPILLLVFILAFLPAVYYLPKLIRTLNRRKKFLSEDQNKFDKPLVPSLGGLVVFTSFMFAIISTILLLLLFDSNSFQLEHLLLPLLSISLVAMLGLADDVIPIQKRFTKPVITLYAAIPTMALTYLNTSIFFPFLGEISLGIFFNLLFIPLVIVFSANAINIMEGYNGLGSGMTLIASTGLLIITILVDNFLGALLMVSLIAPLLVFFHYNKFPAKIFPGNVGTLFFGAVIAITAIISKVEFALFVIMIPFFIHFVLYSRNLYKFKPNMWGVPQIDGTLKCPYKKPYGLMHLLLLKVPKMTEKKVVNTLLTFEVFFVLLAIALFL